MAFFWKKWFLGGGNGLDCLKTHQNSRVKTFSGAPDRLALEFSRSDFSPSRYRVRSPIRADSGSRHRTDGAAPKWYPGGYFGRRITTNRLKFPKKLSTSSFRGSEFRRFWSGDSADVARWVYEIAQTWPQIRILRPKLVPVSSTAQIYCESLMC